MNNVVTTREEIINKSKEIIKEAGVGALTIRTVAKRCEVAVGSIYNYFPSKESLVKTAVEAVWIEIIHLSGRPDKPMNFIETVQWLFDGIKQGRDRYPNFFDYQSMGFMSDKKGQKGNMDDFFQKVYRPMLRALKEDPAIKPGCFTESFTPEGFVAYVFQSFMDSVLRSAFDEQYIIEMIDRILYR